METIVNFPKSFGDYIDDNVKYTARMCKYPESVCDAIKSYSIHTMVCLGSFLVTPIMVTVGLIAAIIFGSVALCASEETSKIYSDLAGEGVALALFGLIGTIVFLGTIFYPPLIGE